MNTFFVRNSQIHSGIAKVTGDDFHHLKNVLRLKIGENAYICNDDGNKYIAKLFEIKEDMAVFDILDKENVSSELQVDITLFQGMPKADKLEKIIKETTQLGISTIVPVSMEHSISKVDKKDEAKKIERWQKIAEEASKQSGRQKIPHISNVIKFQNIIENIEKYDIVLLLYEKENKASLKDVLLDIKDKKVDINNIAIIVGPEGGFSHDEVDSLISYSNVFSCSLGTRILRTELAPIVVISNLVYEFDL